MRTYAAFYNNSIRMKSSSGGIFTLLAEQFDVVFGVSMTDDCYGAEYIRVNIRDEDLGPLRGSKYLQAKMGNTMYLVKKDLEAGRRVLFTGTSCQVNGLKLFLGKEYNNLICVDIICHGTPSPKLWRQYAKEQETKNGKIQYVDFRSKEDGWKNFGIKENHLYRSKDEDSFMKMFLRNYCLRPSCYACKAKETKLSDLTIGDYWGIEEDAPELDDGNGTSLVIIRTQKGQDLFDSVSEDLVRTEVDYHTAVSHNSAEYSSVNRPKERNLFFRDLEILSFPDMEKKYARDQKTSLLKRVIRRLKNSLTKG